MFAGFVEPVSAEEALSIPEWRTAMQKEYDALIENGTWKLASCLPGHYAIKCRWVFKVKDNDNSGKRILQARLVAKGYSQKIGIDFTEKYTPVVALQSTRLFFSVFVSRKYFIENLDSKNAF